MFEFLLRKTEQIQELLGDNGCFLDIYFIDKYIICI